MAHGGPLWVIYRPSRHCLQDLFPVKAGGNGAAWIDIEAQDYRGAKPINFTLPIVAEHRESNMWGYSSGDKAARIAWQRVSVQLTRAMDTIFRVAQKRNDFTVLAV